MEGLLKAAESFPNGNSVTSCSGLPSLLYDGSESCESMWRPFEGGSRRIIRDPCARVSQALWGPTDVGTVPFGLRGAVGIHVKSFKCLKSDSPGDRGGAGYRWRPRPSRRMIGARGVLLAGYRQLSSRASANSGATITLKEDWTWT